MRTGENNQRRKNLGVLLFVVVGVMLAVAVTAFTIMAFQG